LNTLPNHIEEATAVAQRQVGEPRFSPFATDLVTSLKQHLTTQAVFVSLRNISS